MEIILWGTGYCSPPPKRSNIAFRSYTSWSIDTGIDILQFDFGGGVLHKMLEAGIDIMQKPTHLFISHLHIDHTIDLFQLMQGRFVAARNKKIDKLFVSGPVGIKDLVNGVWKAYDENFKIEKLFEFSEVSAGVVVESGKWKVSSSSIDHYRNSVCYRVNIDDKSIVYSGDMAYDERIAELGKNADIAIMECSYPDRATLESKHLCPEDVGKLAKLGNFKKVVLTHMSPVCEAREEEMVKVIKGIAGCEVVVGEDLLKVEI